LIRRAKKNSFHSDNNSLGKKFECLEVPLNVLPSPVVGPNTLDKICLLQEILYGEEKEEYLQAINSQEVTEKVAHPLVQIHSSAVYQKALSRLLETETLPVLFLFQQRHKQNLEKIKVLKEEKKRLEAQGKNKKIKS